MISLKDQLLQMFYVGLRSLRAILKGKLKKLDEQVRELSALVICDAGFVICSLSPSAVEDGFVKAMDLVSFDFLEGIKLVKAIVTEKGPETSSFNFPRNNELGFIDFLLENITDLLSPEAWSTALVNYPIQKYPGGAYFLTLFLGKIVELRSEDQEIQEHWDRVVEFAYRVEFLIDSLLVGLGETLDSFSMSFDTIADDIKIIKAEVFKIFDNKKVDVKVVQGMKRLNHRPSRESKPIINDVVVGFEDEATLKMNRLM
ncbi:putative late blight resistance protein homolog R1B-16 isoform X1 [Coffea arabica]|uniref:Late blight resistance protein homolog R1B-16 isoform X1 n=1 Tax=Coffea arabica TaxID=13443 RepID=A0ABM4V415_COFAR